MQSSFKALKKLFKKIVTTEVLCHKACPPRPETVTGSGDATLLGYCMLVINFSKILYQITILQSQVWARGTKPQRL
jgi:hypothetical protein